MATNEERRETTRRKLVEAGRALFGRQGYAATATPAIAEAAGLSRGALYHHFENKGALFRAVVETEYRAVAELIDRTATETPDPLEALIEGGDAFIDAMADPASRQILCVDGPSVCGMAAMVALDNATTTASLREGIEAAQAAGRLPKSLPAAAITSMMSGAYDRAVLDEFGAADEARLAVRQAIRAVWHGLSRLA